MMMNLANLLIDAACGPVDALMPRLERLAAGVREDHFGRLNVDGRDLFLHRLPGGVWRLTGDRGAAPASRSTMEQIGPLLWRELEAGADTPDGRSALAFSMIGRLTCGTCRGHWLEALRGLTAEHCATAAAFTRWVNERHNDVNRRLGKPVFAWKEYDHEKK